jgi:hypothetical protein
MENDNRENAVTDERTWLTVLFCNALAKYCAPSAPIELLRRFSVMSVYIQQWKWQCDVGVHNVTYSIIVQCIGQILYPFITDLIIHNIQRYECLCWILIVKMRCERVGLTVLLCNTLDKYCAPTAPILLPDRRRVVSDYVEWYGKNAVNKQRT